MTASPRVGLIERRIEPEVCREHAAIETAISAGQADDARRAMTAHRARGIQRLSGR